MSTLSSGPSSGSNANKTVDHWLIREIVSDLAAKIAKFRCRVSYNQSNNALDGLPSITIMPPGRRTAPYVPIAMIVATLQDIYICYQPIMGGTGLDGNPTWNGEWRQTCHFEYANPEFDNQIVNHVHGLLLNK